MLVPITQEPKTQTPNNFKPHHSRRIQIRGLSRRIVAQGDTRQNPAPQPLLSFPALCFHGLGCGKFSIPVWLTPQGACV
jgi:hypothetical protein